MIKNLGTYLDVKSDPNETRQYVLCEVMDDKTRVTRKCYQVYDIHSNHLEDVGFTSGPFISHKNTVMHGNSHVSMTKKDRDFCSYLQKMINEEVSHEHDELEPMQPDTDLRGN